MNPLPLVFAEIRRNVAGCGAVVVLLAIAVGLAAAIGAQERALRTTSARAADRFDLIVGAPGSPTQLVLTTVYLQPAALELVTADTLLRLQGEAGASAVVPVAVTDSYRGYPLVGTTAAFATHDGKLGPFEGRVFERSGEALIGAAVDLPVGARFRPAHGSPAENALETHDHDAQVAIVGRLVSTGTPWDRAIIVPIETVWTMHAPVASSGSPRERSGRLDDALGPPWSPASARPVSAIVVKPHTVADAYRLRQQYRGRETIALFPAEALNPLYALLGNVSDLLRWMAFAFDALLMAAVLLVIVAVLAARRESIGVLRALGAPPTFVFMTIWIHGALLVAGGALGGLAFGAVLVRALSGAAGQRLGLTIQASIGVPEVLMATGMLAIGSVLAALPSLLTLRTPVRQLLQRA
jgi:putative ABC transport system permease protein